MDQIPYPAVALAISLFVLIWLLFLQMILCQAPDAHLHVLLDPMNSKKELQGDWLMPGSVSDFGK